jgi:hypothetical protein
MRLCDCPRPTRSPITRDRRHCTNCGGWTPTSRTVSAEALDLTAAKAGRLLVACRDEYRWAAAYPGNTNGERVAVRSSTVANPTANAACDTRAALVGSWRRLAASFVIEALHALELADAALGEARYVCDPGPGDHVKAAYHDAFPQLEARRDIREAHEAKARRQERGEDFGAA